MAGMRPRWGMLKKRLLTILPSLDQHINKFYMWKEELQLHLEQKQFVLQVCFLCAAVLRNQQASNKQRQEVQDSLPCKAGCFDAALPRAAARAL